MSPIATPQRGSSSLIEKTPQGRLLSGKSVVGSLALTTQDFIRRIRYLTPGVPSNFFSRLAQQSM